MKRFLKKANRGIILGILLLVGTAVYIIIDLQQFKSERPEIESVLSDFVENIDEFSSVPAEYRFNDRTYEGQVKDDFVKKYNQFIDKYWTASDDNVNIYSWSMKKPDMKSSVNDFISGLQDRTPVSCDFSLKTINSVNKDGPNRAVVEATVKADVQGTPDCVFLSPHGPTQYIWDDSEMTSSFDINASDNVYATEVEIDIVFQLKRTSEGWKITSSEDNGWFDNGRYKVTTEVQ